MIRSLAFPLLGLAGGSGIFMLLYFGGPQAVQGELSVGELAACRFFSARQGKKREPHNNV